MIRPFITSLCCLAAVLAAPDLRAQPDAGQARSELVALTVGFSDKVFYDVSVNDARAVTEIWTRTLIKEINKTVESPQSSTTIYRDLPSIVKAVRTKVVDLLCLLPLEFLEVNREAPLEPLLTAVPWGSFNYNYAVLVRQDSGIEDVRQLADEELIALDMWTKADIPQFWLDTLLLREGRAESKGFFRSVRRVGKAPQAITLVFFGQAKACLVPLQAFETMVELNPQLGEQLRVLAKSPGYCYGLICARPDIYLKYRDLMDEGLSAFEDTPQGRQLTTVFKLDRLVPFEASHLESVRGLVQEYEQLKRGDRRGANP